MNTRPHLSDLQLLQQAPKRLADKYQELVKKIVEIHVKKSAFGQLSPSELLQGVITRLPEHAQHLYQKQGKNAVVKTVLYESCRMLCHHVEDLYLLQKQANQLIVKYKPLIYTRIQGYVQADKLREDHADDIAQYVLERLLKKIHKDSFNYVEGRALFRTYFYQIINYTIIDGLRRLHTQKADIGQSEMLKESHSVGASIFSSISSKLDLEQQSELYGRLLQLYNRIDRTKFELSAKVSCAIPLKNEDVKLLQLEESIKIELLVYFGKNYSKMSKEEVWKALVQFVSLLENKSMSTQGLQKWFIRRRSWIIVKILYILNFDGKLQKKLTEMEKKLLVKISDRTVGKFAEEYFGEIVYAYYH